MKTNYQSALERLSRAHSTDDLRKLDASFTRLYNAGIFTVREFSRLTVKVMEKEVFLLPNP